MTEQTSTKKYWTGLGRRKSAVARVKLLFNEKSFSVNEQKISMPSELQKPFELVGMKDDFGIAVKVNGGGKVSQLSAITLGIARALEKFNPDFRLTLKKAGLLTRDPRDKERKKPGLKGARRSPQWAKR